LGIGGLEFAEVFAGVGGFADHFSLEIQEFL
jgi:hypothetical protein